ncbi:MAG: hypothetical protein RLZZ561_1441 [Pseudomonadota bacterium]|jgi:hypothetical protein
MGWHLAQINVARFRRPQADPANADFMNALDHVNAMADASPGFVWRLVGDGGDATDLVPDAGDPNLIVNMSVWTDLEALSDFVYRQPDHLAVMRRRRDWFDKMDAFMALWWVPAGHRPSILEGMTKIALLAERGPSAEAFTFHDPFPAPGDK